MSIPGKFMRPWAPLMGLIDTLIPLPQAFKAEAVRTLGNSWLGTPQKAKQQLGWQARPLEEGLKETLSWMTKVAENSRR